MFHLNWFRHCKARRITDYFPPLAGPSCPMTSRLKLVLARRYDEAICSLSFKAFQNQIIRLLCTAMTKRNLLLVIKKSLSNAYGAMTSKDVIVNFFPKDVRATHTPDVSLFTFAAATYSRASIHQQCSLRRLTFLYTKVHSVHPHKWCG